MLHLHEKVAQCNRRPSADPNLGHGLHMQLHTQRPVENNNSQPSFQLQAQGKGSL